MRTWLGLLPLLLCVSSCSSIRVARVSPTSKKAALRAQAAKLEEDEEEEEGEEDEAAPAEWNRMRRAIPETGEIPADRALAAARALEAMPRISASNRLSGKDRDAAAGTGAWEPLGPGNVGGRTRSLLIHPTNPNILYAGAVTGGVLKSVDGGATWTVLTDGLRNLNIGALAFDPANPQTIFAGGGEVYDVRAGIGIHKSTDAGATWTLLSASSTADFQYVNRIVVSRGSSSRIYAATRTGILSSRDGGATWSRSVSAPFYGCVDLAARNDATVDYLYAVCSGATGNDTFAVYRNSDASGAGTWTSVFTAPNMGRSVIAIAPSLQTTIYVAAAGNPASPRDGTGIAGAFRSTSSGDPGSWTTQAAPTGSNPFNYLLFGAASSASSYCSNGATVANTGGTWGKMLAVDPLNPNRVWVGGVDLYRSDDGGVNWGVASRWDDQTVSGYAHADRHGLIFDPGYNGTTNQVAYHLTDSGVFKTLNAAAAVSSGARAGCTTEYRQNNAVAFTSLVSSYPATQFFHGVAYPGGAAYFGGSQDTGLNRGVNGAPEEWAILGGGDGESVGIDPIDPNRILISAQSLSLLRAVNGANFRSAVNGITESNDTFPFSAYLAVDPVETSNVYIGGTTNLWRSTDWAATWTSATTTGTNGAISAITVSPFDSNTVIYGTTQGILVRGVNTLAVGGGTWTASRPRPGFVSSIAFDPVNQSVLYAVYSSLKGAPTQAHVYRSSDGGQSWLPFDGVGTGALPDTPSWRLLVNPRDNRTLYLATDQGLMVSNDGGTTWGHDDGLPTVVMEDLAFDTRDANNLFAFTYGRGAFRTALPGAPLCSYNVSPLNLTAGPEGGTYPISVSAGAGCAWSAVPVGTSVVPQSPATGVSNGNAYVSFPPNLQSGASISGAISIAGKTVKVSQAAPTFINRANDSSDQPTALTIPSLFRFTARTLTSAAGDPVHSCTTSADFGTAWWSVTPAVSGFLNAAVRGDRLDVFGNSGIVLTAYAQADRTKELGCVTVPRDNVASTLATLRIPVTAGTAYILEVSATSVDGLNANYNLIVSMGNADAVVTINPLVASIAPGSQTQLTASVTGPDNKSVRWSISPTVGSISQSGIYTAPATVGASTDVTITATSFADATRKATAKLTIAPTSSSIVFTAAGVVNGATFKGGGVAPGEIITVFGAGFGASSLTGLSVGSDGKVTTVSGGTSILFDGVPAPMVYAVSGQLAAVVPYSVAGKSTSQVQIAYNGALSSAVAVPIATAAPGFFTANSSGAGQLAMFNQDYSLNNSANPAARGSIVLLYGTGEGQTDPPGVDGQVNNTVFPKPVLPVRVTIGGVDAQVAYFGAAPGFVAGVFQANVVVPANAPTGASVSIQVSLGTNTSPNGTTIAVK